MSMRGRTTCYLSARAWLATWLGAATLLGMRLWVALAFWQAGLVKIASPETTRYLFENMYHVSLLPPDLAAVLGTWIELVLPWFIGLGLLSRPFALFLFIYNIVDSRTISFAIASTLAGTHGSSRARCGCGF